MEMFKTFTEALATLAATLAPYGDGFAFGIVAIIWGAFFGRVIFPKGCWYSIVNRKVVPRKPVWFYFWGRKTLSLQPFVVGCIFGWFNPRDGQSLMMSGLYFGAWGAGAVWAYHVGKDMAKKKGVPLDVFAGGD
jgi:hypothetical protein